MRAHVDGHHHHPGHQRALDPRKLLRPGQLVLEGPLEALEIEQRDNSGGDARHLGFDREEEGQPGDGDEDASENDVWRMRCTYT